MKKRVYLLVSLLLAAMFSFTLTANADEAAVEVETEHVLQAGGLLAEESTINLRARGTADYTGAIEAMKESASKLEDSVSLAAYAIPQTQMSELYALFMNQNPEFFYLSGCYSSYSGSTGLVISITWIYQYEKADIAGMVEEYNHEVDVILNQVDTSWTDLEKILFINDYLAANCEYDLEAVDDTTIDAYDVYAVLVKKKAVCQGYALTVVDLMERMSISSMVVTSEILDHAWNLVLIDNQWYHVDVTWNDPVPDTVGAAQHSYLLKSTEYFHENHVNGAGEAGKDYVYSGSCTDDSAVSTIYDKDYFWDSVRSPFIYYNNEWYVITYENYTGWLRTYDYVNGTFEATGTYEKELTGQWQSYGAYLGYLSLYDGKLYYSTPTSICYINLSNYAEGTLSYPTSSELSAGDIYGMHVNVHGELVYTIASDYDETGTSTTLSLHTHTPGAEATCTTPQVCTECGKVLEKAFGHISGAEATCTTDQVCTRSGCGEVIVEAYGHIPNIAAATCTDAQYCTRTGCGQVIAKALGHAPNVAAATCTTAKVCTRSNCGLVMSPALNHPDTVTEVTKKATFVSTGTEEVYCNTCQKTIKTNVIAKLTCTAGKTYTVGNYKYKIIKNKTDGTGTVVFVGLAKSVKKVVIGNTVTIKGAKFKIVQVADRALRNKTKVTTVTLGTNIQKIGKEAFSGMKKVKTITIKSKKLTSVGKNALKNVYKYAKIKVPKTKLAKYKKLFKNKGQKSTVKIVK